MSEERGTYRKGENYTGIFSKINLDKVTKLQALWKMTG
jgi:hypothetical protein